MVDFSSASGLLLSWLLSPVVWLVIIFLMIGCTFGVLKIRKRRKLIYPLLEIVDIGGGKSGFNLFKCGWFGKRKHFKGLWDSGEERMESRDGEVIHDFSSEDYQEINGKRGVVVFRDPVNSGVLVPINKANCINAELLTEIAPANFRDVALDIIKDADKETADYTEKLIQWLIFGTIIIFAMVSVIVITQMVKSGQKEASDLIIKAGEICLSNAREVCSQIAGGSVAP